jgi:hypothetical protein
MKTKDFVLLSIGFFIVFVIGFIAGNKTQFQDNSPKDWTEVGGNIDIQYYLEASEDSIWIEDYYTKKVYGGKYSDLKSMVELSRQ